MKKALLTFCFVLLLSGVSAERVTYNLEDGWRFSRNDSTEASTTTFNDSRWECVKVPHDWAIYGPFDKEIDKQTVRITQNNEKRATEKYGRTGALPHIGVGWYRLDFELPAFDNSKEAILLFEGAMSHAEVFVNGERVGERGYGYSYFYFDISQYLKEGESNLLAVRLENPEQSSRWYPGAGLYRNVSITVKERVNIDQWGVNITTPQITEQEARVNIRCRVKNDDNVKNLSIETEILDADNRVVATDRSDKIICGEFIQDFRLATPKLWSPESPNLYYATNRLYVDGELRDEVTTRFGVREIDYSAERGFTLNGEVRKFKGVCLHHDLGALGAAVNVAALRRQLTILKDMGCNAIRSAHNMPSFEQLELCDEMGFLFLAESFDEWAVRKVKNGYSHLFEEWAEADIVNLVSATRNHPSIVMWSSGNEVPDQHGSAGVKRAKWLQEIFHREDPTRPVTVGMDQVKAVMASGFASLVDVPGLNYRVHLYEDAYEKFPQGFILGSETASTVSSRGVYKFPVVEGKGVQYDDRQCSSYDLEACSWSNIPEDDFILQDDKDWVIGEFVWTGFDYLGEPTPYDTMWSARSSYFGICDLAGLPKDRFYLYRSRWNSGVETLHILPHWNWEGREGETTPVFVYTNYDSAELFVNGVSQGVRTKDKSARLERYRLMWSDVKYEAGELRVVAYDDSGEVVAERSVRTAGEPYAIELSADREVIAADGKDISFVTASVVDRDGNLCPMATNRLNVKVRGAGDFRAMCNGDATSLELFHLPTMEAFSGKLVIMVESNGEEGTIRLNVSSNGLKSSSMSLKTK
ncbi:MAG: beta-galactosidase GalB [Rikenellaceae bacterium]